MRALRRTPSFLFAVAAQLALIGLFGGALHLWNTNVNPPLWSSRSVITVAMFICVVAVILHRHAASALHFEPLAWISGLLIVFVSDWMSRPYALYDGPAIRGEILCACGAAWYAFSKHPSLRWGILAVCGFGLLFWSLLQMTGGAALFTDDHAAVIYRLQLLKENFPAIPFYNPLWNAGMDARDFFATGILNFYLLGAPIIHFFNITSVYTWLVACVVFVLLPTMTYLASRHAGIARAPALIAAILSVSVSSVWYRWFLKYGAMGFVVAACLFSYNTSVLSCLLSGNSVLTRRQVIGYVLSLTLMLCWSLTAVAMLPFIVWGLFRLPRLMKIPRLKSLVLLVFVLNLPWMFVFISVSQVARFTSIQTPGVESASPIEQSRKSAPALSHKVVRARQSFLSASGLLSELRQFATKANPVLLLLGLPGLLLLPRLSGRTGWCSVACWLLVMGFLIAPLKPQLELERMLILLLLLLCVPAGQICWRLWNEGPSSISSRTAGSIAGGFVIAGVFAAGSFASNHSLERYTSLSTDVQQLANAIREHGGSGRTLFTSFVLHELDGGHLAPLAGFSGKPLIASSPTHNLWWYHDVIPEEYSHRGETGIEEYFDLLNVTAVVAHEQRWKDYLSARSNTYKFVWSGPCFSLYRRMVEHSSYFISGEGVILEQTTNRVRLRIDTPSAVLKFIYYPFLKASSCQIGSSAINTDIHLIKLNDCKPGEMIEIRSVDALSRVLLERKSRK